MNRLTKEIGLVLISSSLMLHGCAPSPPPDEEVLRPETEDFTGTSADSGSLVNSSSGGRSHHAVPYFYRPGFSAGNTSRPGTSSFSNRGAGTTSRPGTSSFSSHGSSSRGGFGASAHGGGS